MIIPAVAVSVTLEGGPCDGRIVHVFPHAVGRMPRQFAACLPADQWGHDGAPRPSDYHTYMRVGDGHSRTYRYWRDLIPS